MQETFGHAHLDSLFIFLSYFFRQIISHISIYCFAPLFIPHIADFLCLAFSICRLLCTLQLLIHPFPPPSIPPDFSRFFSTHICSAHETSPYRCDLSRVDTKHINAYVFVSGGVIYRENLARAFVPAGDAMTGIHIPTAVTHLIYTP